MKGFRLLTLGLGWALASWAMAQNAIVAQLTPGANPTALAALFGVHLIDRTPEGPFALFQADSHEHAEWAQLAMRNHAEFVFAEDDDLMQVIENNNGKGSTIPQLRVNPIETAFSFENTYGLNATWLQQIAWSYDPAPFDQDVRVAILDTGLSFNQASLWSRVVASMTCFRRETSANDAKSTALGSHLYNPNAALGHGTMVAGIVAQVAPEAQLVICRVAQADGTTSVWRLIRGLAFAVAHRAQIANISMGSLQDLPAMNDVLEWARNQGTLVVAAAGNNAAQQLLSPASASKAICVTAVDPNDHKASFSNWHNDVDFSAPGTGIASAWWTGQTATWSGTSFAVPIVSGSLADALRFRAQPLTPDQLFDAIKGIGDDIDAINPLYTRKLGTRWNHLLIRQAILNAHS